MSFGDSMGPLCIEEAANWLRVSPRAVHALIRAGDLRAARIGRQVRIAQSELERFVRQDPLTADVERLGSVKVAMNAKHEAQFEVKAFVGESADDLERAAQVAVERFRALEDEFGIPHAGGVFDAAAAFGGDAAP